MKLYIWLLKQTLVTILLTNLYVVKLGLTITVILAKNFYYGVIFNIYNANTYVVKHHRRQNSNKTFKNHFHCCQNNHQTNKDVINHNCRQPLTQLLETTVTIDHPIKTLTNNKVP